MFPNPATAPAQVEHWCFDKGYPTRCSCRWTIDNFSFRSELTGCALKSSISSGFDKDQLQWQIEAYPNGLNEESKDYVSVFLTLVSSNKCEIKTKFEFSLLNDKKEKINVKEGSQRFRQGGYWGFNKFINRNYLLHRSNGLLPGDKLTILCEVMTPESYGIESVQFEIPEGQWKKDMSRMFLSASLSDVTLCIQGDQFPAHRVILSERCQKFNALFEEYPESTIIDVPHIAERQVLLQLLRYIYTGEAPEWERWDLVMTDFLLEAAHFYGLDRLKAQCEEKIFRCDLSVDTATWILARADANRACQLKTYTINFIKEHATDVMNTPGWREMIDKPHLMTEVCRALAETRS